MRNSRFDEEQIIQALKEHEAGVPTAETCRRMGVSDQSFHRWKAKYGGLEVPEARRLKQLEVENAKLLKMIGHRDLDLEAMWSLLRKKGKARRPPEGRVNAEKGLPGQ